MAFEPPQQDGSSPYKPPPPPQTGYASHAPAPGQPAPGYAPSMAQQAPPGRGGASPHPAPGKRRLGLLVAGLVLAAAGVIAGLLILGSASTDDAVKKFARAPIGCSTTMNVEKTATFNIYLESAGRLPEYGGDCPAAGTYSSDGSEATPEVVITHDGDEIELREASGESYDAAGFKGRRVFTAKLEKGEGYRITVTAADATAAEGMAIAVGADSASPSKLSSAKTMGIAALIAGPLLGLLLIALGSRRRTTGGPRPAAATPVGTQPGSSGPPTSSPGYPGTPGAPSGWSQPPWQGPDADSSGGQPRPPGW